LYAENNVGAGLSEDFAKISKHKITTCPPQPESSAHPIQRLPKIHLSMGFIDRDEFDEGQVFI
jgi:hypothetical protein